VAVAALIDRSGGSANFDVPFHPLATLTLETYAPEALPAALAALPVTEPDDLVL
jgi:orotate phosphoribosyltransferase